MLTGVGYIRIGLAFLLPQQMDTVFLFFGELLVRGIDVGLMFAVEVSLRQLGFGDLLQKLGIGAGVVVNKVVPAYALMVGVPAKQIGWMSEYGEKLDLPISGDAQTICEHTGQKYQLKDSQISVIS